MPFFWNKTRVESVLKNTVGLFKFHLISHLLLTSVIWSHIQNSTWVQRCWTRDFCGKLYCPLLATTPVTPELFHRSLLSDSLTLKLLPSRRSLNVSRPPGRPQPASPKAQVTLWDVQGSNFKILCPSAFLEGEQGSLWGAHMECLPQPTAPAELPADSQCQPASHQPSSQHLQRGPSSPWTSLPADWRVTNKTRDVFAPDH